VDRRGHAADLFQLCSVGVESAADTLAMISSACATLGERALICAPDRIQQRR